MLIGNLSRDPEMRYTPSGRPVTTFVIVTQRNWNTSEGEKKTEIEKFNVVTWGNLAEICNHRLIKGTQVYIEGRLQTRLWEDKEGVKHHSIEIVASEMLCLGSQETENQNIEDKSSSNTLQAL